MLAWLGRPVGRLIRFSAAEKREIIHLVEHQCTYEIDEAIG
jgi:hypothetical protein